jgi:prolyl oligopeptidase
MHQPVARVEPVEDVLFGVRVEDPYRWMEDHESEEARAWIRGQNEYTRAYLDALPGREALLERIAELRDAGANIGDIRAVSGRTFYTRHDPGEELAKLVVRSEHDAGERVLLDPNTLPGDALTSIEWYAPSWDGRLVVCNILKRGTPAATLHLLDTDAGTSTDLGIADARFDDGSSRGRLSWLPDNRGFLYNRLAEPAAGATPAERYLDSTVRLHALGGDPTGDRVVLGRGVSPRVEMAPEDAPFVEVSPASEWMLGLVIHGDNHPFSIYAAPVSALHGDAAEIPWARVAGPEDGIVGYAFHADTVYLRSGKGSPRYKVIATSLRQPDLSAAPVVVPEGREVIQGMLVAGGHLLLQDLDGGVGRLRRVPLGGGEPERMPLPFDGSIGLFDGWNSMPPANGANGPEVLFASSSWTVSPRILRLHTGSGAVSDTGWLPPSPIGASAFESREVLAPGRDGTPVPLSIIHRRGLALDGDNPAQLHAYGAYGHTFTPFFWPAMFAWYERGGVLAIAHARGGVEYGEEWHEAGRLLRKQNTVDDMIACAAYLIEQGYTRPERLAAVGSSAGGIPAGNALVQRPDLWGAVFIHAGMLDCLRFEFSPNGPGSVPEFGSVATEDGFRALLIADSYSKVRPGTPYPAVLLAGGMNDTYVVIWQATKMAARLQAATTSGKPVLLRVQMEGGHHGGTGRSRADELMADVQSFLLDQLTPK